MCLFGSSCVQGVCEAAGGGRDSRVDALFSVLQALTARLGYEQGVEEEGVPRLPFAWGTSVGLVRQAGAGRDLVPMLCLTVPSLPPEVQHWDPPVMRLLLGPDHWQDEEGDVSTRPSEVASPCGVTGPSTHPWNEQPGPDVITTFSRQQAEAPR